MQPTLSSQMYHRNNISRSTLQTYQGKSLKCRLWEYRRMKRRLLSPVSRGLIVGAAFTTWVFYCYLFQQEQTIDNEYTASSINSFQTSSSKRATYEFYKHNDKVSTSFLPDDFNAYALIRKLKGSFGISTAHFKGGLPTRYVENLHRNGKNNLFFVHPLIMPIYFIFIVSLETLISYSTYNHSRNSRIVSNYL